MNEVAQRFGLALAALLLAAMPALAQDATPAPAPASAWRVVLTPYLWLPGINAEVTSRNGRSIPQGGVSASASELLPQLHGVPFVGAMEIGYGRFSLLADLITLGLRTDAKPRPGYLFGTSTLDTRTTLGTVIGFWRVGESAHQFFDIGAGIRVTALSTDLRVSGNRLPGFSSGTNSSHVDGLAAFRYGLRFAPAWGLTIAADIGGGGSRLSWEALGSLDWHVSQGTTNLELGGPFLAASFRF